MTFEQENIWADFEKKKITKKSTGKPGYQQPKNILELGRQS